MSSKRKVRPDIYFHDSIVHEDELILSYLNSFAYTVKLWVESKQEIRISETIDKFACIITAYLHGRLDTKFKLNQKEKNNENI